jgi:AraC-like DNA-binding protein
MDRIVENPINLLPAGSLTLSLARTPIHMRHDETWVVDKKIGCHDLFICLSGRACYLLDDMPYEIAEGQALFVPAGTRYRGRHGGGGVYTGLAQHFTLSLFNAVDLFSLVSVRPLVGFTAWPGIRPLVEHYLRISPRESVSLRQNYLFMTLVLEYLNEAFDGWKGGSGLPWHVMDALVRIGADILDREHVEDVLAKMPYSREYFIRVFRAFTGHTPAQFQQVRRIERAKHLLQSGRSVKETACLLGYSDPFYFSRLFKKRTGISPARAVKDG